MKKCHLSKIGSMYLLLMFGFFMQAQTSTWNGFAWSNGIPTSTIDAVIEGNYTTGVNGEFIARRLYHNNGIFTVSSGTTLRITQGIFNNQTADKFIVENNGNLRQTGANAFNVGEITLRRNSSAIARLDYTLWSSPVSGQNLKNFSPQTLNDRFYSLDPQTNTYIALNPLNTNFKLGYGYLIRAANNHPTSPTVWNGEFIGVPNNGPITVFLNNFGTGQSFNFVGNPYPSPISINSFINANSTNINGSIYFWRKPNSQSGSGWSTCTLSGCTLISGATNPNGQIRQGQGFMVELLTGITKVEFTNAMRTSNIQDRFFRSQSNYEDDEISSDGDSIKNAFWLNLSKKDEVFDQILVAYDDKTTNEFDALYDGKSLNRSNTKLYSFINKDNFNIQARAIDSFNNDLVDLGFEVPQKDEYTLSLDSHKGIFKSYDVFVRDILKETTHNLTEKPYFFESLAGIFDDRFKIFYRNKSTSVKSLDFSIHTFVKDEVLHVTSFDIPLNSLSIYDLEGRMIFSQTNINSKDLKIQLNKFKSEIFLLEITDYKNQIFKKKIIK